MRTLIRLGGVAAFLVAASFVTSVVFADEPQSVVLIPQVWIDASENVFHAPGCKKITEKMTHIARTVAKMQGIPAAKECAETDAQARERWKSYAAKVAAGHVAGFSDFGETVTPPKVKSGVKKLAGTAEAPVTRSKKNAEPAPDRNAVMAASNYYDARDVIGAKCSRQWGGDAQMVSYCVEKQLTALSRLEKGRPFGADPDKWGTARVKCAQQWPDDYSMRVYCEGKAGF